MCIRDRLQRPRIVIPVLSSRYESTPRSFAPPVTNGIGMLMSGTVESLSLIHICARCVVCVWNLCIANLRIKKVKKNGGIAHIAVFPCKCLRDAASVTVSG